jgi:hypothetical protein
VRRVLASYLKNIRSAFENGEREIEAETKGITRYYIPFDTAEAEDTTCVAETAATACLINGANCSGINRESLVFACKIEANPGSFDTCSRTELSDAAATRAWTGWPWVY